MKKVLPYTTASQQAGRLGASALCEQVQALALYFNCANAQDPLGSEQESCWQYACV